MADLIFSIETLPTVTAYDSESELLNPALFIAIAAEGQEEILYVEELEKLVKKYSSDINIIILNKFYARMKDAISLSHPSHRYELIEKWREYYSQKCGITENEEEWLICDRDNQSCNVIIQDFILLFLTPLSNCGYYCILPTQFLCMILNNMSFVEIE